MKETEPGLIRDPRLVDWVELFRSTPRFQWELDPVWQEIEIRERREDLAELDWLLSEIRRRLEQYREEFPHRRFEQELVSAFRHQADKLEDTVNAHRRTPEGCDINAYLAVKYEIRTLFKQVGSTLGGSDWQTPSCEPLGRKSKPGVPAEVGFIQEEQGTYMRSYGSEYVKSFEEDMLQAYYPMSEACRSRCIRFLTTSGMSALELALAAYKKHTSETLPCYVQRGFYGEGADLANVLLEHPRELEVELIYELVERGEPIGCLLVDPGVCWPVEPAIDLDLLMAKLQRHRQDQPLYVIVDRTLTGITNPLFDRYGHLLSAHVVLVSVESGIKYYEFGLDLVNVGFLVAVGEALKGEAAAEQWVGLLGLLTAGADPVMVRQLPVPDAERLEVRLRRLNRNALWIDSLLRSMVEQGIVLRYDTSVQPSAQYRLDGMPWIGSVLYIQLMEGLSESDYQAWIDRLVADAPDELHLTSGGSFGFDTFRFNTVTDTTGERNALRMSVGRDPLGQLLGKLHYLYRALSASRGALGERF